MHDTTLTHTEPEAQSAEPKAPEEAILPRSSKAIQRWIRLDDTKTFGSITGSDFRIWDE